MSGVSVNTKQIAADIATNTADIATNTADITADEVQRAVAWINCKGSGTVSIRNSFNVSSFVDDGTGLYTVNLTNAVSGGNYCVVATAEDATIANARIAQTSSIVSGSFVINTEDSTSGNSDAQQISAVAFAD